MTLYTGDPSTCGEKMCTQSKNLVDKLETMLFEGMIRLGTALYSLCSGDENGSYIQTLLVG